MTQQQLEVGAKVKINERSNAHPGRTATVKFTSGGQYWVRLDDSDEVVPALHRWMLDPV